MSPDIGATRAFDCAEYQIIFAISISISISISKLHFNLTIRLIPTSTSFLFTRTF
ncbi:hypothetical protein SODALDRAFT_357474 [Sodiomyces alkalinus F11]|uniref:Uncharacterized protein n=1 Tax=Sodiomyces alkalinus (strain CBS 110278 / VKM F-3762 / F11) TaxID=1314773 RepID=A0A3N2Q3T4_SODAK|nr:hypothetical protein SODALDRAFT_357474 [Sodiomyces alkalinus F11]ROT41431.1 hypothetical protein SODALDRAFT_357474 [Sodiomyces alkalinus F11]